MTVLADLTTSALPFQTSRTRVSRGLVTPGAHNDVGFVGGLTQQAMVRKRFSNDLQINCKPPYSCVGKLMRQGVGCMECHVTLMMASSEFLSVSVTKSVVPLKETFRGLSTAVRITCIRRSKSQIRQAAISTNNGWQPAGADLSCSLGRGLRSFQEIFI